MFNECFLSLPLMCQVVERLCQGEGRCTVAVTSHQAHCADRCGGMVEYEDMFLAMQWICNLLNLLKVNKFTMLL